MHKGGGKSVPIHTILDHAYVQDHFLAYYGVCERIIRPWSCTTINTVGLKCSIYVEKGLEVARPSHGMVMTHVMAWLELWFEVCTTNNCVPYLFFI